LQQLTDDKRKQYDTAREHYHARLVIVSTPTIRHIAATGRKRIVLNRYQHSARLGLIVTGAAGTGKTTAITQLGKNYQQLVHRDQPQPGGSLPVAYVTVPPAATPKMLAVEFARFLGLPLPARFSQVELTNKVCDLLGTLRTTLILIDETTQSRSWNPGRRRGIRPDQVPVGTCPGHLRAGRSRPGRQRPVRRPTRRSDRQPLHPDRTTAFPFSTSDERAAWQALVATLENALRLHAHRKGTLLRLSGYLHERTGGMIGSLSHLIREAAIDAIINQTEKINQAGLDTVDLDQTAEQHRTMRKRRRRTTGRGSAA
jgi:Cdc6-like AAA superfamily ATPase